MMKVVLKQLVSMNQSLTNESKTSSQSSQLSSLLVLVITTTITFFPNRFLTKIKPLDNAPPVSALVKDPHGLIVQDVHVIPVVQTETDSSDDNNSSGNNSSGKSDDNGDDKSDDDSKSDNDDDDDDT